MSNETTVYPRRKAGRCADGFERGQGSVYHALRSPGAVMGKALCGTEPGRRSVGWSEPSAGVGAVVNCPRCLRRMRREGVSDAP